MLKEEVRFRAVFPGSDGPIPLFRADFLHDASKSVQIVPNLPVLQAEQARRNIPERGEKCELFQAFLGAFSRYSGECVAGFDEKEKRKAERESLMMSRHFMRESPSSKSAWQRGRLSGKLCFYPDK
ncbi:MAG TPA: hypothetical protein VKB35_05510 [Ktedonobacteraceae bacterium]|nr:hypothetical protein [Ktedonobacteraceae bacterium]